VPPLHPLLAATTLPARRRARRSHGEAHADQVIIALLRDGFHPDSVGGSVGLKGDGSPVLDYPLDDVVRDGLRRAFLTMARSSSRRVRNPSCRSTKPRHPMKAGGRQGGHRAVADAGAGDARRECARDGRLRHGTDPKTSVVRGDGRTTRSRTSRLRRFGISTSIGSNPQLSIYGLAARNASLLATALTGRPAPTVA